MAARIGPKLRSPPAVAAGGDGGLASATLFTIGMMMPIAPASSILPMMPGSFHGTRTNGVQSPVLSACSIVTATW